MRSARRLGSTFALAALGALAVVACGTDAVGVDACRRIESARCQEAPRCGIDLTQPAHPGAPATDVEACTRFYRDQCLHGLATPNDPGSVAVQGCVDAIHAGDCAVVRQPETSAACTWLIPPAPPPPSPDASADASADASSEGG